MLSFVCCVIRSFKRKKLKLGWRPSVKVVIRGGRTARTDDSIRVSSIGNDSNSRYTIVPRNVVKPIYLVRPQFKEVYKAVRATIGAAHVEDGITIWDIMRETEEQKRRGRIGYMGRGGATG